MPRFDANLSYLFTETDWERRFDAAARAGFKAVEINAPAPYQYPAADLARHLTESGLECVVLLAPTGTAPHELMGIAVFPERQAVFRSTVHRALEYAERGGAHLLHILAGRVPSELAPETAAATYIDNMGWAADLAAQGGVTLGIEPVCRARFNDYLISTTEEALAYAGRIGRPNVKLIYDCYHAQMQEGHISATLQAHIGDIAHVQIGNPPGRHEPGNGELDFNHIFAQLDGLGYAGWVGCEYLPSTDTSGSLAWARPWNIGR